MIHAALSGRTAIVTGAGCAAGAAAACALSRAGATVVLAGQSLDALASEILSAGGHAIAVPTDLTNPVSVRRLVEQTLGAFGRLDAAFNNTALSLAMRYQIPPMRRAGRGRIVNLTATAAALTLTRTAAHSLAGSGVLINAITTPAEIPTAVAWLCSDDPSLTAIEQTDEPRPEESRRSPVTW